MDWLDGLFGALDLRRRRWPSRRDGSPCFVIVCAVFLVLPVVAGLGWAAGLAAVGAMLNVALWYLLPVVASSRADCRPITSTGDDGFRPAYPLER